MPKLPGIQVSIVSGLPAKDLLKSCSNVVHSGKQERLLIDRYIPEYHYRTRHHATMSADQEACFIIAKNVDMGGSYITKLLMKLRGLPTGDLTLQGFLANVCFIYTAEELYHEFVIDASQSQLEIFWNFHFHPVSDTVTLVSTETRVRCLTSGSKRRFAVYWFFVRPFSSIIRGEILRMMRKSIECKNKSL